MLPKTKNQQLETTLMNPYLSDEEIEYISKAL
jgi:hypothetical protein